MRQSLLCLLLLSTSLQAAPLCPVLIERLAGRPAIPKSFQTEIWQRFGPVGKLPNLQPNEENQLFMLSDLQEQITFFEQLDRSLAQTGNVGMTKRQADNLIMGTLWSLMGLTTAYAGYPMLAVLMGGGAVPLFYFSLQTQTERLDLIAEVQSVGVFREQIQQQARILEDRPPNTQIYLHKDFAGPFSLTVACRIDDRGKPTTLVLVKFPREIERPTYYDNFH